MAQKTVYNNPGTYDSNNEQEEFVALRSNAEASGNSDVNGYGSFDEWSSLKTGQINFRNNTHEALGTSDGLVSNLIQGGQLGYGFKAGAFDAATPLAFPPAVIVVLQTPTMWDNMPNDLEGILRQTVKCMFECHAKSVTGIDINYTLENQEQPVGHDGQQFQVPTQSKRAAVQPSFTYPEVSGNLVWNIHRRWIWDINDPDTNAGLEHQGMDINNLCPFTMSTYSVTFMAIQFDQTQHPDRIIDAAVYTNVFPTTTGEMGIQREIGTTTVKERAIQYTGYVMHNDRTRELGRTIANQLSLRSEAYHQAAPFSETINNYLGNADKEGDRGIIDDTPNNQTSGDMWDKTAPAVAQ